MLVLRADAGSAIGTGHVMRLLALGQAWLDDGGAAQFLVAEAPDWLTTRFDREGIEVRRINAAHPNPADSEAVVAALAADPDARAVVDGLHVDEAYLDALAPVKNRVLAVDDMANLTRYPVAMVLNQNAHADRTSYPDGATRYLLGLGYTLLRREFRADPPARTVPPRARHLLVTFGGADPTGMTLRTIEALAELGVAGRDLDVVAVAGAANPAAARLEAAAAGSPVPVTLERSVEDMASRMTWADLAVMSADRRSGSWRAPAARRSSSRPPRPRRISSAGSRRWASSTDWGPKTR